MRLSRTVLALTTTASLTVALAAAQAQAPGSFDTVEEDWQLVIGPNTPDVIGVGPQITTVMSPAGRLMDPFVAFDLNYKEYPSFTAGGMQVQVWASDVVAATASQGNRQFQTANETITWTQGISVVGGVMSYYVQNGSSTTWGHFGQGGLLDVQYAPTGSQPAVPGDLSAYSPDDSAANSGASWESNLVASLTLVQVRYFSGGSLVSTDTNPRSVTLGN
jgi:hypothetical protein